MASHSGIMSTIAKLDGRSDFCTWQFAVKAYLEREKLWQSILGTETDDDKNTRAKSDLILLIKPINYAYISTCDSAKKIWEKLQETFEDSGLCRRVSLIRELTNTKLEDCKNMENYVNIIMSAAHKLNGIAGGAVSDDWIATFLLAGLTDKYEPMIMAIESSGVQLTGDYVKTKLLQEPQTSQVAESSKAFAMSKSKNWKKKVTGKHQSNTSNSSNDFTRIKCFTCQLYGHKSPNCPQKNVKKNQPSQSNVTSKGAFCVGFSTGVSDTQNWFIDSGASYHMSSRDDWFVELSDKPVNEITVADNSKLIVKTAGKMFVDVNNDDVDRKISVLGVLHIPDLSVNLLSVSQLVSKGHTVIFDNSGCQIIDSDSELVATGRHINNMFVLNQSNRRCLFLNQNDNILWHRRMGHLNQADLVKLKNGMATGIDFVNKKDFQPCVNCLKGKQFRFPFPKEGTRASSLLEIVHSDLCGPMENASLGGARYFISFIDDFSRKVFVYFLETKTKIREIFENFKVMVENQMGCRIREFQPRSSIIVENKSGNTIKILRTDNGSEYVNRDLENFLKKSGIRFQTTNSYTPQQNGLAERMNRTIVEKARCMIFDANLAKSFWAEAVNTAVYVINRSPTKGLNGKTPEEIWSGKAPDLRHIKVFGCRAMVHIPKPKRKKWDPKSQEFIFVGYCQDTKGYRLIHPTTKKLTTSRDVVFLENQVISEKIDPNVAVTDDFVEIVLPSDEATTIVVDNSSSLGFSNEELDLVNDLEQNNFENGSIFVPEVPIVVQPEPSIRRSERQPKPRNWNDFVTYSAQAIFLDDPTTVAEALSRHDGSFWKKAILDEYNSLLVNETWDLVDLPQDRKAINCKWVFKTKRGADGHIIRYKARLVIKGYAQTQGIDYEETYSPVVRYTSLRYLMSLAVQYDLDIEHLDFVTAFLQGELDEEIYMVQPKEFAQNSKVCRLKKAIYGLKQASRQWNKKLDLAMKDIRFQQSTLDPCVYFMINGQKRTYVAVYVDDSMLFSNDDPIKRLVKTQLARRFQMKDLGEAQFCIGIRISRDRQNGIIYLDQKRHILDLLAKFNMKDCNPVATPADPNQKLSKSMSPKTSMERDEMKNIPYQEAVGGILYIAQCTRPDITFAVNSVSRFNNDPGKPHWEAVKRILRYLKGTMDAKLTYSRDENLKILGYCDADWASDEDERRSCTGYVFIRQGGAISWNSKRQPTVALSSAEAEYMALSSAVQEVLWLRQFEMNLHSMDSSESTNILCDNNSAIDLSNTNGYNARTKHIDIRHHFIRQVIQDKDVTLEHISTEEMVADVFTKPLSKAKYTFCSEGLGMKF